MATALLDLGSGYETALRTVMSVQRLLERVRRCEDVSSEATLLVQEMSRQMIGLSEGAAAIAACLQAAGIDCTRCRTPANIRLDWHRASPAHPVPRLQRPLFPAKQRSSALGVRQLTAAIVNATVGADFVLPALVSQGLVAAARLLYARRSWRSSPDAVGCRSRVALTGITTHARNVRAFVAFRRRSTAMADGLLAVSGVATAY
jgi:hypothetical protein